MTTLTPSSAPVPLGQSGIAVSPLAWGMWRLAEARGLRASIDAALAAGISLFDTADVYGCDTPAGFGSAEALFGEALAELPGLRGRIVIATKGGIVPGVPYDASAAYLAEAVDASLRRLRTDRIDLYQIHRRDFLTHPQEAAGALARLVEAGKVRAVGVSNHTAAETEALQAFLPFPLASTQPEFSPLCASPLLDGTFDHAMRTGLAVLAWSPLGGGRLADPSSAAGRLLAEHGAAQGADLAAAALSWAMVHPARPIPIVGSQNPARILAATGAFSIEWTRAQWYAVLEAGTGRKLP